MTHDTDMTDMSRVTYVKAPADRPLGLDVKQFEQDNQSAASSTYKRDLEFINDMMD